MVSGTISLPFRGSFHLSLAVLVHYRSVWVFSLGSWPTQIPTRFSVSRGTWDTATVNIRVKYRAFTFFGWTFQFILLQIFNRILQSRNTPDLRRGFRLIRFRSPLLTESLYDLFSSGYLDVSVPRVPPPTNVGVSLIAQRGITPFGNQRLVAPVGGLTVGIALIHASFFGSNCQGIRHWHDFSHLSRMSINDILIWWPTSFELIELNKKTLKTNCQSSLSFFVTVNFFVLSSDKNKKSKAKKSCGPMGTRTPNLHIANVAL